MGRLERVAPSLKRRRGDAVEESDSIIPQISRGQQN